MRRREGENKWLKAEIEKGMDDIAAGRVIDGKVVLAELKTKALPSCGRGKKVGIT